MAVSPTGFRCAVTVEQDSTTSLCGNPSEYIVSGLTCCGDCALRVSTLLLEMPPASFGQFRVTSTTTTVV